jgi:hypothetical protein
VDRAKIKDCSAFQTNGVEMDVAVAAIVVRRGRSGQGNGEPIVRIDVGSPLRCLLFLCAFLRYALLSQRRANQHYTQNCQDNRFHRLKNILSALAA